MATRKLIHFDWAFKKILRQKANYDILEGLLSVLLKQDIVIKNLTESESNKETADNKFNKVDILAETTEKELIIIELQIDNEIDYFQRMAYGTSKAIAEYMNEGKAYKNIKKIFSVNIVFFDLGKGKDYVYQGTTEFRGLHENDLLELSERQKESMPFKQVSDIFPEYFILKVNAFNDITTDDLDQWLYVLKNSEVRDDFTAKGIDKAKEKLAYETMTETEKRHYKAAMENESNAQSTLWTARVEGEQIGIKKGEQIGMKKGEQIGIKKGEQVGISNEKRKTAFRLFDLGFDDKIVSKGTQLSLLEVQTLRVAWEKNKKKC